MQHLKKIFSFIILLTVLSACSDDDNNLTSDPFVVAFETLSENLGNIQGNKNINLVYSTTARKQWGFHNHPKC